MMGIEQNEFRYYTNKEMGEDFTKPDYLFLKYLKDVGVNLKGLGIFTQIKNKQFKIVNYPSNFESCVEILDDDSLGKTPHIIDWRIHTYQDIINLCMLNNAIKHKYGSREKVHLILPYIPCGRQDRVVHKGESLSLEVIGNLINTCDFEYVYTLDPHSSVTNNFVKNLIVFDNKDFIKSVIDGIEKAYGSNELFIFAPDEGASKKIYSLLAELGISPEVVVGSKTRNNVGQITKYGITYDGNYDTLPRNCLIIDDICDGGATFTNASKKLRESIPRLENVFLAVTHGLFTKGLEPLLVDGNINQIFTTDSVCTLEENEHLTIVKV